MDHAIDQHVEQLHRRALTVDAHFDLAYDIANRRDRGEKDVIRTRYLENFETGGFNLIVSSIFIHDFFLPEMGLRKALDQISYLLLEVEELPDKLMLCMSADDIVQAKKEKKIGIMLSLEGAEPLQNDINLLRIFYELGVRGVGLTWSRRNYAGDGSFYKEVREGRKGGLTNFGVDVIKAAEALGMFVDVSHLNDEGLNDVIEFAEKPLIASHSNCRSIADVKRNLTDTQIKALAGRGGVIGMNALNKFTGYETGNRTRLTSEDLINHVDHIVQIAGIKHVGLGFDFCDGLKNHLNMPALIESYDVLDGHRNLSELTAGLIRRGYSDDDILLILGGNFSRFFTEIL